MRCLVMGAGAVGSYFGAQLAKAGADVTFVARGAHGTAMATQGIRVYGPRGEFEVTRPRVYPFPDGEIPDVILLTVKTYATDEAIRSLRSVLGKDTVLVTLQNGLDSAERISKTAPEALVIPGLAYVSAVIERPGVVAYTSDMSSISLGQFPSSRARLEKELVDLLAQAGTKVRIFADMRRELWTKFLLLSTNAMLTALARAPAGVVYHDPDLAALAEAALHEVAAVATADGVELGNDAVANALQQARAFPPDMYASMYHDLARGLPIELDHLTGVLLQRARKYGISVPVTATAYACLKPYRLGAMTSRLNAAT